MNKKYEKLDFRQNIESAVYELLRYKDKGCCCGDFNGTMLY